MENNKPLLCRIGLHYRYRYLPKVGGDLGEISIACKRCGYGYRYFQNTWDITPNEVQKEISQQAEIEYGRVLGFYPSSLDARATMTAAYNNIKDKFSEQELEPIKNNLDKMNETFATFEQGR